jgi:hypothetical protein
MPEKPPYMTRVRVYRPNVLDAELLAQARECIKQARAALELLPPSTFLGQRHREGASKQNNDE